MPVFTFILPTLIYQYVFGASFRVAWYSGTMLRYAYSLNCTWLVNSAAHIYGMRPYDRAIRPVQNKFVSIVAYGEGWHNYHHVFPWDYKTAELGDYSLNWSTAFINLFAKIGMFPFLFALLFCPSIIIPV